MWLGDMTSAQHHFKISEWLCCKFQIPEGEEYCEYAKTVTKYLGEVIIICRVAFILLNENAALSFFCAGERRKNYTNAHPCSSYRLRITDFLFASDR
jgi:hypothetical protein